MDYFLYKKIASVVEQLARDGVEEFYPSVIKDATETDPKDYLPVLGNLVDSSVLKRKFITDLDSEGNYKVVSIRDLGEHDPEEVYVKYEILKEFTENVVNKGFTVN